MKDEAKKAKNTRGNHKGTVEAKKAKNTRGNHEGIVAVPYVKGLSEAFARIILKCHGIATANRPHRTLRNVVVHPKDKAEDEKTELVYRVPCKNCSSSYVGETGRKFGLRIKEHKKEVDSFTAGTQTRASREEQCNSQVSHHRPCRGREPCHRLGQGKSGRQRGTATDQIAKRGILDREDTDVH